MNKFKNFSKRILKNKKGQGIIEYVLLLVIVVALVVLFKDRIKTAVTAKTQKLGEDIQNFNAE